MKDEEIFELVKSTIVNIVPKFTNTSIQQSDSLKDIGLNSIERMEVTMVVMEELDIDIPRVALLGPKNIAELVKLLSSKLREPEGSI